MVCANESTGAVEAAWRFVFAGEVSFHSSLSFHKAEGNQTDTPRQVFTIIFMDKDMKLAEPETIYQHRDRDA